MVIHINIIYFNGFDVLIVSIICVCVLYNSIFSVFFLNFSFNFYKGQFSCVQDIHIPIPLKFQVLFRYVKCMYVFECKCVRSLGFFVYIGTNKSANLYNKHTMDAWHRISFSLEFWNHISECMLYKIRPIFAMDGNFYQYLYLNTQNDCLQA